MDGLIKAMNKLQDAFSVLGQSPLDLPQIAVVGGQSAGKSSVLENIVGKDFLPRGSGIVTRRPLVLKLITIKGVEYAEFLHLPGEKFTDWAKVRAAIENATETDPNCANKGISKVPINLTIYSPTVLNLTLIDLPGMTRVAVGDQPPDINEQIRAMLMHFITQENTIILAVTPANQDLANSDAMQLAKEVDPQGHRTVGVLTKLDLMDRGTDAIAILNNKVIPLKHGYVPVVNRSQADINENKALQSQWSAEEKYFRDHPRYGGISERCGTSFLTRKLNKILASSIREHLPEIVAKINSFMDSKKAALNNLKEIGDAGKKAQCVLQSVGEYSEKFRQMMEGRDDDADINQISGGAKILSLFDGTFVNELQNIDVLESLSPSQLRNIIRNSSGLSGGLFIPDEAFQVVIRRSLKKLEAPSLNCVQLVYDELMKQAMSIVTPVMSRYTNLHKTLHNVARTVIAERMGETRQLVTTLIAMEQAHINTSHPDFTQNISLNDMLTNKGKNGRRTERGGPSNQNHSRNASSTSASSGESKTSEMLIEGWMEIKKEKMMGSRWSRQWGEIRDRVLIYSKTDHQHNRYDSHSSNHATVRGSMVGGLQMDETINPLQAVQEHTHDPKEKNIPLNGGSVNMLEDQISFVFTPSVGKQITMRCPDRNTASKWVQSITVALSTDTWNAYVEGQMKRRSGPTRMRSPSAHAMVSSGSATQNRAVISQGGERGRRFASGSMSDNDIVQAQVIEHLLDSYYDIVRVKVQDSVPKAITLKLVNAVKKTLHGELVAQIYGNEEKINRLLSESDDAQRKRDQLKEVLGLMEEAMAAVQQVQTGI